VQPPARVPEGPLPRPLTAEENTIREQYDVKHGTLMSSLTPQQKTLYDAYLVAPTEPGRISAAETRFSISLSIEQLNLFDQVRKLKDQIQYGPTPVAAPAGATPATVPVDPNRPITPPPAAPAQPLPSSVIPLPAAPATTSAPPGTTPKEGDPNFVGPPAPKFELSMETGGKYTVNPQVQAAQQIMADLKKAGVAGIELGATGANKDGVDGKFGPKTRDSIIAVEKALGIDPPTGKLTTDLVDKMKAKAQELAARPAATAAVPGAPNVGPAPAATPASTPAATPAPAVTVGTPPASTTTTTTIPASTVTAAPAVTPPPTPTTVAPTPPSTLSSTTDAPPAPTPPPRSEAARIIEGMRSELMKTPEGQKAYEQLRADPNSLTPEQKKLVGEALDLYGGKKGLNDARARDAGGLQRVSAAGDDPMMDYLSDYDFTGLRGGRGKVLYANDTAPITDTALAATLQHVKYGESIKGDPKNGYEMVAALRKELGIDGDLDPDVFEGLDRGSGGFDQAGPGAKPLTMRV